MTNDADSLVVAFATLDGVAIPRAHFGEAQQYEIYRITADDAMWLESVTNPKAVKGMVPGPTTTMQTVVARVPVSVGY